jgi:hypothetical protein
VAEFGADHSRLPYSSTLVGEPLSLIPRLF